MDWAESSDRGDRRRVQRRGLAAWRVATLAALCSGAWGVAAEALAGCQGPPAEATAVSRPTVVFVWPCFALQGISPPPIKEDPRFEAERARDQEMSTQYLRIREGVPAAAADLLKQSGAVHLRVLHPGREAEVVRTTTIGWRGVFVLCPNRQVRRIGAVGALASDSDILKALGDCGQQAK